MWLFWVYLSEWPWDSGASTSSGKIVSPLFLRSYHIDSGISRSCRLPHSIHCWRCFSFVQLYGQLYLLSRHSELGKCNDFTTVALSHRLYSSLSTAPLFLQWSSLVWYHWRWIGHHRWMWHSRLHSTCEHRVDRFGSSVLSYVVYTRQKETKNLAFVEHLTMSLRQRRKINVLSGVSVCSIHSVHEAERNKEHRVSWTSYNDSETTKINKRAAIYCSCLARQSVLYSQPIKQQRR